MGSSISFCPGASAKLTGPEPQRIPAPNDRPELGSRRPAHHTPTPERAMLVEDLLSGQQDPKALQPLLDAHISTSVLKRGFKLRSHYMQFAYTCKVDLCALCEHVLHSYLGDANNQPPTTGVGGRPRRNLGPLGSLRPTPTLRCADPPTHFSCSSRGSCARLLSSLCSFMSPTQKPGPPKGPRPPDEPCAIRETTCALCSGVS
jgi:hypothetical protein